MGGWGEAEGSVLSEIFNPCRKNVCFFVCLFVLADLDQI